MTTYTDAQMADACDAAALLDIPSGYAPVYRAAAARLRGLGEQPATQSMVSAGCAKMHGHTTAAKMADVVLRATPWKPEDNDLLYAAAARLRGLKEQPAVPREPTQAMLDAVVGMPVSSTHDVDVGEACAIWRAMFDTATDQPAVPREPTGWMCPACGRSNSPTNEECGCCGIAYGAEIEPGREALVAELRRILAEPLTRTDHRVAYERALAQIVADGERSAGDADLLTCALDNDHNLRERIAELERALREILRLVNDAASCGFSPREYVKAEARKALEGK